MDSKRWLEIDRLFQAALEMAPGDRAAFLDKACTGDNALRSEVESLLNSDNLELSILDAPAFDMVAGLLVNDTPELSVGQYIGHYKILDILGTGGMGEVYLAHDSKLGRRVALKLLPADFTTDEEQVRRFQQEARATSALNHPNILTIYEIGQFETRHFIATEFIDGQTLRQLMKRPLSMGEALDIAAQAASALAAAHHAGIVHRDIKPENIMLRPDGYVKVLDFGLAKLTHQQLTSEDTEAPTVEKLDTIPGVVLGTVRYMSPEQARGLRVDGRSDIFSLGVVLYEMIAGRAPFEGETTSDLIASILKVEPPPLTEYSPDAPAELQRIVSKALSKDKEDRYQTVNDMLADLKALKQEIELESKTQRAIQVGGAEGTARVTSGSQPAVQTEDQIALSTGDTATARTVLSAEFITSKIKAHKARAAIALVVFIAAVAAIGYGIYRLIASGRSPSFQGIEVSRITTSGKADGGAISPDGRYVAYLENDGKQQNLWIRQINTSSSVQVASATNIGTQPTFSPDGDYLYYVARSQNDTEPTLYRMPYLGGVSQKLIAGVNSFVAVSPDGKRLAFMREYPPDESAIVVANADGTEDRKIASRKSPEMFLSAVWSPDGMRLACVGGGRDDDGFYGDVVEIGAEGEELRPITDRRWSWIGQAAWLSDGSGLIMNASAKTGGAIQLWQISYPSGEARRISTDLNTYAGVSIMNDSSAIVSQQTIGVFNLYIQAGGDADSVTQLTSGPARMDGWSGISWTPDGRIVYSSSASGSPDIWIMKPDGSDQKQLTVNLGSLSRGLSVSPDGRHIVFVSQRAEGPHVWRVDIDGGNPKRLSYGRGAFNPFISPDGKWVFYFDGADRPRAWKVPIDGGEPVQLASPFSDIVPRAFSPDGKLIVFRPSGGPGQSRKLGIASSDTGELIKSIDLPPTAQPRNIQWSPDGQAITYIDNRKGASNLWLQPLDGGPARQLTNFKEYSIHLFAWSPDGKYLVFMRGFQTSDIVLINSDK